MEEKGSALYWGRFIILSYPNHHSPSSYHKLGIPPSAVYASVKKVCDGREQDADAGKPS